MKTIFKFGTVVVSLFIATLTCIARDVSKEQFLKALFKGKEFPVTLTQSPTYPWKYDSNSVKATSRQEDVNSDCWFALDIYVPKDSASVSFDYQVRYHKEAHGWAKYATLSCQIDGKEVFGNNGTDKMESATIKIGKGFHTLKWNLKLGEAWENWDYFGAIENMSFEGISDKCALPEYSKTSSSTWCLPFTVRTDTIVIENLGKEGFEISSLDGLTAPFYLKSSPSIIPPGKSDAILVGYAPQEEGCHEQTLTLLSNWGKKTIPYHGMSYGVEPICNSSPGKLSESVKNYNVESATIFGPMNRTDNYTLNKFKKLKHLDLRGTDMKYIFNGGINNLYLLEDILLPSSLKYIDATWISKHWDSASKKEVYYNIKTITCMSPEPPKIVYLGGGNEEYEFNGLKSDVIIYVPARYLAYYEADAKWNKFKIMPIMNDSKSLHIKFDSSKLPDYSGCSIELMEERSQQTQRLTVGNTVDYVFHNLKPEKSYTLNLIHPSKRILAAKDSVTVGESNETVVQFDSIEPLYKATLQVVGTDNINLTDKVQGHWITPHENDRTGTEITQLMEGDTIKCIVSLPKEIGKRYQIPDTVYHIVNTANNTLEINLFPHKKSTVKGIVLNIDNEPIQSASISARQTLNGNLPWNSTLKTDTDGRFELEAYEGVIALDISADKYFSTQRTDTISGIVNLGELRLLKCEGREIRLNVTFRENDIVGKEGYVSAGYDRWKDLVFTVFDSNSRNEIKNVKVEYPRIYLLDEITGHSSFTLKVSSRNKAFEDFEVNCESIDAGNFTAEIQIVEHGDIRATYNQAYTDEVLALLYDKNGNIRQSSNFVNNGVSLKGIPDGKYTLVAIESDELYNRS